MIISWKFLVLLFIVGILQKNVNSELYAEPSDNEEVEEVGDAEVVGSPLHALKDLKKLKFLGGLHKLKLKLAALKLNKGLMFAKLPLLGSPFGGFGEESIDNYYIGEPENVRAQMWGNQQFDPNFHPENEHFESLRMHQHRQFNDGPIVGEPEFEYLPGYLTEQEEQMESHPNFYRSDNQMQKYSYEPHNLDMYEFEGPRESRIQARNTNVQENVPDMKFIQSNSQYIAQGKSLQDPSQYGAFPIDSGREYYAYSKGDVKTIENSEWHSDKNQNSALQDIKWIPGSSHAAAMVSSSKQAPRKEDNRNPIILQTYVSPEHEDNSSQQPQKQNYVTKPLLKEGNEQQTLTNDRVSLNSDNSKLAQKLIFLPKTETGASNKPTSDLKSQVNIKQYQVESLNPIQRQEKGKVDEIPVRRSLMPDISSLSNGAPASNLQPLRTRIPYTSMNREQYQSQLSQDQMKISNPLHLRMVEAAEIQSGQPETQTAYVMPGMYNQFSQTQQVGNPQMEYQQQDQRSQWQYQQQDSMFSNGRAMDPEQNKPGSKFTLQYSPEQIPWDQYRIPENQQQSQRIPSGQDGQQEQPHIMMVQQPETQNVEEMSSQIPEDSRTFHKKFKFGKNKGHKKGGHEYEDHHYNYYHGHQNHGYHGGYNSNGYSHSYHDYNYGYLGQENPAQPSQPQQENAQFQSMPSSSSQQHPMMQPDLQTSATSNENPDIIEAQPSSCSCSRSWPEPPSTSSLSYEEHDNKRLGKLRNLRIKRSVETPEYFTPNSNYYQDEDRNSDSMIHSTSSHKYLNTESKPQNMISKQIPPLSYQTYPSYSTLPTVSEQQYQDRSYYNSAPKSDYGLGSHEKFKEVTINPGDPRKMDEDMYKTILQHTEQSIREALAKASAEPLQVPGEPIVVNEGDLKGDEQGNPITIPEGKPAVINLSASQASVKSLSLQDQQEFFNSYQPEGNPSVIRLSPNKASAKTLSSQDQKDFFSSYQTDGNPSVVDVSAGKTSVKTFTGTDDKDIFNNYQSEMVSSPSEKSITSFMPSSDSFQNTFSNSFDHYIRPDPLLAPKRQIDTLEALKLFDMASTGGNSFQELLDTIKSKLFACCEKCKNKILKSIHEKIDEDDSNGSLTDASIEMSGPNALMAKLPLNGYDYKPMKDIFKGIENFSHDLYDDGNNQREKSRRKSITVKKNLLKKLIQYLIEQKMSRPYSDEYSIEKIGSGERSHSLEQQSSGEIAFVNKSVKSGRRIQQIKDGRISKLRKIKNSNGKLSKKSGRRKTQEISEKNEHDDALS